MEKKNRIFFSGVIHFGSSDFKNDAVKRRYYFDATRPKGTQ